MKNLKKVLVIVIAFALCMVPMDVHAAGKNVTASMKQDKNLKKITHDISHYTTAELCNAHSKNTKTEHLNGYNALSIAGYLGAQYNSTSYSQKYISGYTKKEIQKITYDLFGKKPKTSTIPSMDSPKRKWIAKNMYSTGKPYQYSGGNWGHYVPLYSIQKIVKIKKNVYDVTVTNRLECMGRRENVGTTYIRLQKNPKSLYKYKVIRLKHKGNGNGFF